MKLRSLTFLAVAIVLTLGAHALYAAVNAYLYVDGVAGESPDAQHRDWIEVLSLSSASLLQGTEDPAARARLQQIHSFTFTKKHDKATPKLYEAACKGTHLPEVVIEVWRAGGGKEYLKYKLTDVLISSVQASQSTESLTFNFAKIEFAYKEQGKPPVSQPLGAAVLSKAGAVTPPTPTATPGTPAAVAPKK